MNIMTRRYAYFVVFLVMAIAYLNYLAYIYSWYWHFRWFDMVMHFAGGAWVAFFALWIRFLRSRTEINFSSAQVFGWALAATLTIGILWELFEFSVDSLIAFSAHNPIDTASDLFFDSLGAIVAAGIFFLMYNKVNTINVRTQS